MIEITEKTTDKDTGNVSVSFRIDKNQRNIFKWTRNKAAEQIRAMGVDVGEMLSGEDVCNKPNFPSQYIFVFKSNKLELKQEKDVDKPEETVILKKARSRKPKKTTGG
jgi:hypothetical protein